ncbi:MAG: RnfABCDGE type electron transport complex subunit D [Vicinamibacteria bacterium]
MDPRHYQIATLGLLLTWGLLGLDFDIRWDVAFVMIASALLTQWVGSRAARLSGFDPRSALISILSLCLLLRTNYFSLAILAAVLTIGSKFLLRFDSRHLFNPTNFGIAVTMAATGGVWVSPGQWGTGAYFAFLLACLGGLVVHRAERSDITYAFIAFYALVLFGRAAWLSDPLQIPLHQVQNGAFLLFAFFMISDPKTTPESRAGRVLFALLVALGAGIIQFVLFRTNGLLWSLLLVSPTTPLWNRLFPGRRYEWKASSAAPPLTERSFA